MSKQDDLILELTGKVAMFTAPIWIPGGIYWYAYKHPEQTDAFLKIWMPIAKTTVLSLALCILFFIVAVIIRYLLLRRQQNKTYRYVRLVPHIDCVENMEVMNTLIYQFHGYSRPKWIRFFKGREWFHWLVHRDTDGIAFYVGFPVDREIGIRKALENAYPAAELHPISKGDIPLPRGGTVGKMRLTKKGLNSALPLAIYRGRDYMGDTLKYMQPGTWLSLAVSPDSGWTLRKKIRKAEYRLLKKKKQAELGLDSFQRERLKSMTTRFHGGEKAFQVSVSIESTHEIAAATINSIATSISSAMNLENGLYFDRSKTHIQYAPYPLFRDKMIWTGSELANLLHLPNMYHNVVQESVPYLEKGQRMLDKGELAEGISIGTLQHPVIQNRRVSISKQQFTKHFALTGRTGSGKSSTAIEIIQDMINDWIENPNKAPGFSFFDPASVTALTVINRLLKAEKDGKKVDWNKVHYIRFKDTDYPPALNLLHRSKGEDTSTVVANIMNLFRIAYPTGATPRMDRILENSLGSLLADKKKHSVLGVVPLLTSELFQARVRANLTGLENRVYKDFWEKEIPKNMDVAIDPVLNRISPFRTSTYMRRMFGRTGWSLEIRKWMDEGHIVLFDLIGMSEQDTTLVVGHIVTQYHQTAIKRPEGSKLHMTMIDEAHLVQIPILPTIIAFDRKFGLSLGLITQYIGQFDSELRLSIQENVANIFTCGQGKNSAAVVEEMVAGRFERQFLQTLPDRIVAVSTQTERFVNGRSQYEYTTCIVVSDPPYIYLPNGEIANYKVESEMAEAKSWALEKANELQKRDGDYYTKADQEVAEYLGYKDDTIAPKKESQNEKLNRVEEKQGETKQIDLSKVEQNDSKSITEIEEKKENISFFSPNEEAEQKEESSQNEAVEDFI